MNREKTYQELALERASALLKNGHISNGNLRELLICTTSEITYSLAMEFFNNHLNDAHLLKNLFTIALEGEDSGDAPWAAANIISEFPAALLEPYKIQILELAAYEWVYLKAPAEIALRKISAKHT